jgi:hypothetical protein
MVHTLLLLALTAAPPPKDVEKPIKPLPVLGREPSVDGELKDLAGATDFKMPPGARGASAELKVRAAFKKDTVYVGVTVKDDVVTDGDHLDLTLYFPGSGTTSKGVAYRFGKSGLIEGNPETAAPDWAQPMVKAVTRPDAKGTGYTLEIAIPARALPRFQAFKQLALSLCADYADVDAEGSDPVLLSSCPNGEMPGGPTRIPDEFRKTLKLTPTAEVEGIEAREHGWVGYSKLHYPTWVMSDTDFTPQSLAEVVLGEAAIPPDSVALPIPPKLMLPDNRPIFTMLSGKNPYLKKEGCIDGNELRLAMYVVKGSVASRVLEWPAATCKLGRGMRFELSAEGELTIGYTNGSTAHFSWSGDHFERSELGLNK